MSPLNFEEISKEVRKSVVRMICSGRHCHAGTSLSSVDILVALYFSILKHDPKNPSLPDRDYFILSKGHGSAALYATLAHSGYFPVEQLSQFVVDGSPFTGHVNHHGIPGVELSTGSLGHGLPVGLGLALAAKRDGRANRVFVVISDGELDEGSNWEALLAAGNFGLDNLNVVVDYNKIQSFGTVDEIMPLEPLADKFKAFNWEVREVDGHSFDELLPALSDLPIKKGKPNIVIANTVKGKGVSFMEHRIEWHYLTPSEEQLKLAEEELS